MVPSLWTLNEKMILSRFMQPFKVGVALGVFLFILVFPVFSGSKENKVFSKRRDLSLLVLPSVGSKTVATAKYNEALNVTEQQGRWMKVSSADGEGWVYSGNVSLKELDENENSMSARSSSMTATAASRGLSGAAEEYAQKHDLEEVAEQLKWAEKVNLGISKDEVTDYLKNHRLGEYTEIK